MPKKKVEANDNDLIPKDPNWRPYCCKCSTMIRMAKTEFGFRCRVCQNEIGPDMMPLKEPFNMKFSCGR